MTEPELLSFFEQSLTTLAHLTSIYDNGFHPIALQMATEIHKLLTQGGEAARLRGLRTFTTIDHLENRNRLNALHKLVGAQIGGIPPKLDFLPIFLMEAPSQPECLDFKDWWNKDVIYRASAAIPGTDPGLIPVNGSPSVPFEKREWINRRDFVALLRNKLGAHQDADLPILIEELENTRSWGSFSVQTPDGVISTDDGSLATGATMMAAMMRQIAHEVLIAYGRDDVPTNLGTRPAAR